MTKIIINSHVKYSKPRDVLFDSLSKTQYKDYNNIIVVLSGSHTNKDPYLSKDGFCIIESTNNNFDYNGFNVLNIYKNHNLIVDNFYLYLHDTVTFDINFLKHFDHLEKLNKNTNDIYISNSFHSNICFFGKDVIINYKNNFSIPLSKEEAIYLELHPNLIKNNKIIKNISYFGNVHYIPNRIDLNKTEDIYQNGYPRKVFYYPLFGIYKWVLWGKNGDFVENKARQNKLWW